MGCTPSVAQRGAGPTSAEDARRTSSPTDEAVTEDDSRGFLRNHQHARQNKDEGDGALVANKSWKNRKIPTSASGDKDGLESKRPSTNRSMQDIRFGPMFHSQQGPMKVLLVFGKEDAQSEAFWTAAEKLGHECCLAKTADAALDAFQDKGHNVIIVDVRHSKHFDGEELCRSIRNTKWSQHTVIVAVVKRSLAEREDSSVLPLLKAGFTRWFVESHSVGVCLNELVQLQHSEVHPRVQLATAQALYVALDKCKDLVHVTDSSHNLQYLNRASERLLGYRTEELVGHNLLEMHQAESVEVMMQQLHRGHEWEGWLNCKRKTGDTVSLSCRIIPTCVAGRSPTHFVYIQEPPPLLADKALSDTGQSDGYPLPRGSLRSLRKGSYDIKSLNSDGSQAIRRQSLAKLHSLTIEAPITRVITLIYAAQENSPPQVAQILDKVVEILRTTELYSPQLMQEEKTRTEDPVATDLIGALLSQGPKPLSGARRSSSESAVRRELHQGPRASLPATHAPVQLKELLDTAFHWEFDIFQLEDLTNTRPLVWLGMNLMCHFDVTRTLGCDESTLQNWLTIIEANYHSSNSYHNSTHAADVLQATACFLERERMKQILDPVDEATCLIAAAVHDVDHPGKSSAFLCNSGNDLAILYNDLCVLESHHSALTFKLTMSDDRVNIFKGLETDMYKVVRQSIIDMVLATEMTKHFEHMSKFVNVFTKPALREEENYAGETMCDSPDISLLTAPENIALVKRMLIKCADVSNPTRPLRLSVEWARRIAEEYFNQTDEEKLNGLPVVMPVFDRLTCSIPRSQIGFVEYIINDMFEAWEAFIDMPELLQYLKGNYQFWKEKEQQGITSIQDFVSVQDTIEEHDESRTESSSNNATTAAGST